MFRLDRIEAVEVTGESFRPRRVGLIKGYVARLSEGGDGYGGGVSGAER